MKTHPFAAERIEVVSKRPFAETVAAFERRIPMADTSTFVQLVTARATAAQIEQEMQRMAGDLGFLTLAKIDQGPLVSLLGKPKEMSLYLIGNPVLANRMYEQDPAVGVYNRHHPAKAVAGSGRGELPEQGTVTTVEL